MNADQLHARTCGRQSFLALMVASFLVVSVADRDVCAQARSDEAARFQLADTYLRAGQFDRAVELLQDLYRANPDYAYFARLTSAYESTKRYGEAIALIDERIASEEAPVTLYAHKGRLLYMDGRVDEANEVWQEAIDVAPTTEMTYRVVYQSVTDVREFSRGVDVLFQGRRTLRDSTLFASELGYLYGMLSEHGKAMGEFLGLIRRDQRQLANVKSRLGRVSDQPGVVAASVEVVDRAVRAEPQNRAFRELLGWLYVEAGLFRRALETYRAIDRLEGEEGRVLFTFAGQAASGKAFDVALDAYSDILKQRSGLPIAAEALRGKAEMHRAWANAIRADASRLDPAEGASTSKRAEAQYELALESFEAYARSHPENPNYPYVLLDIATLNQDVLFRLDAARTQLETIISRYPNHPAADQAAYQFGLLLLLQGDLEASRLQFARLDQRLESGDLAEEARYQIAMIHFYRGEFVEADAMVANLKENTSNDAANDAIGLRVLLLEGRGPDSLSTTLREFAQAQMLRRQRDFDGALRALEVLQASYPRHALVDEAMFEQAEILLELDRVAESYQQFAELPLRHPSSHMADRSLFEAASIQETRLGNYDKAIELYTRLMVEYPGSLLVGEARLRIRALLDASA